MMTLLYPTSRQWRQLALCSAIGITTFISACSPLHTKDETADHTHGHHNPKQTTPVEADTADTAIEVGDVWEALPKGFGLPEVNESKISNHLRWYGNNQRYIDKISEQSRPFLYYVKTQLAANDMPLELALLPIVESAYDPLANSPSRAAGIWQFMPHTGRNFGLQQNQWYDGRRDLIASTDAAIRYLKYLHNMFDDWLLAVAAYNAGEGTIKRAISKNQRAGHKADFWSLPLSQQTRSYVPQLLALSKVVANPAHYDLTFTPIADEPYFIQVPLTNPIDLAQAAAQANVDAHQLRLLNAGHIKWLTLPPNDKTLLVPIEKAPALSLAINQLPALGPIKTQANYKVKAGDTLGGIAQRFGTKVAAIQTLNRMKDSRLRVGQELLIPDQTIVGSAQGAQVEQALADKRSRQQQQVPRYYQVKAGDSLWSIAKKHGVKVAQLLKWNNLSAKATLKPGQKLIVAQTKSYTSQDGKITYKIQPGDTLYTIASRFEVSHKDLLSWNQVKDASYIHPGQELTILK